MVDVVELADARHAGERHLRVGGGRQPAVRVRVEPGGHRVHALAPGPEGAIRGVGLPTEGSVERVRVCIGKAGQRDPGEPGIGGLWIDASVDRVDDPGLGGHSNPVRWSAWQPGSLAPIGRHPPIVAPVHR